MGNSKTLLKPSKKVSSLDKFAGKWVAFDENERIVGWADTLEELEKKIKKLKLKKMPFYFLVPRKDEGPYVLYGKRI